MNVLLREFRKLGPRPLPTAAAEAEQLRAALELNEALRAKLVAENQALRAKLAPAGNHPDDFAVASFAEQLKAKMRACRAQGRSGWNDPLLCPTAHLQRLLAESIGKGDPIDTGNYAMMLHNRQASTAPQVPHA